MNYSVAEKFLDIFKFVLEHADDEEFLPYDLLHNFHQLLIDLESNMNRKYSISLIPEGLDYETNLEYAFYEEDERSYYKTLINSEEKKLLLERFQFIIVLNNFVADLDCDQRETLLSEIRPYLKQFNPFREEIRKISEKWR